MFNIGDRVCAMEDYPSGNTDIYFGDAGTVCYIFNPWGSDIGVAWDKKILRGHTCQGHCDTGHGWRVRADEIDFQTVELQKISETDFLSMLE